MRKEITREGKGAAAILTIGNMDIYMSFDTVVALRTDSISIQTDEHFSTTTAKHRKEMRCDRFTVIPEEDFKAALAKVRAF